MNIHSHALTITYTWNLTSHESLCYPWGRGAFLTNMKATQIYGYIHKYMQKAV